MSSPLTGTSRTSQVAGDCVRLAVAWLARVGKVLLVCLYSTSRPGQSKLGQATNEAPRLASLRCPCHDRASPVWLALVYGPAFDFGTNYNLSLDFRNPWKRGSYWCRRESTISFGASVDDSISASTHMRPVQHHRAQSRCPPRAHTM